METVSKTRIDQLGDRLRKGHVTDADLRLLDEYRRSFTEAYDRVVGAIRSQVRLEPTGRPAKSTTSITEKLRRESIRLTQVQDIAGCRIVVSDIAEQERAVTALVDLFPKTTLIDRRQKPSHGYRAIHLVVAVENRAVEIQVRTALQQVWAELSEKLSDLLDPVIKYGGGEDDIQILLTEASDNIGRLEGREHRVLEAERKLEGFLSAPALTDVKRAAIIAMQDEAAAVRANLQATREGLLNAFREAFEKL